MASKLLLSAKLFKRQMKSLADSNNKESEMGNDIFSEAIGLKNKGVVTGSGRYSARRDARKKVTSS